MAGSPTKYHKEEKCQTVNQTSVPSSALDDTVVVVEISVDGLAGSGTIELSATGNHSSDHITSLVNQTFTSAFMTPCPPRTTPVGLFTPTLPFRNTSTLPGTSTPVVINTNPVANNTLIPGPSGLASVFTGSSTSLCPQWPATLLCLFLIAFQFTAKFLL
jgi:hypothetical protein